jgi:hypothetical protein
MRGLVFKVVPLNIYTLSVEQRVNIMAARDMTGTSMATAIWRSMFYVLPAVSSNSCATLFVIIGILDLLFTSDW